MKILFSICFSMIFWTSKGQDYYYYQEAFEQIIASSDAFKSSDCYCKNDFIIMEEIVPFDKMSFMFLDKLGSGENFVRKGNPLQYPDLEIGKKKSKLKVFFTEQKDGVFFAEFFCDAKKGKTRFSEISSFGLSQVYMFKVTEEGTIALIDQKEISSN